MTTRLGSSGVGPCQAVVATILLAYPGLSIAWELIPWRGYWGRHCSSPAWSERGNPVILYPEAFCGQRSYL